MESEVVYIKVVLGKYVGSTGYIRLKSSDWIKAALYNKNWKDSNGDFACKELKLHRHEYEVIKPCV